jgi:hypothetical protein
MGCRTDSEKAAAGERRLLRRRRAAQGKKAIAVKLEARYLITVHMS